MVTVVSDTGAVKANLDYAFQTSNLVKYIKYAHGHSLNAWNAHSAGRFELVN